MAGNQSLFEKTMNQGHSAAWDMEWDRAAAYYRKALEIFPDNAHALSSLAAALLELQDHRGAYENYVKASKASPKDPLMLEKIALICEAQGDLAQGAEAAYQAAELHVQAQDIDKALENWQRATRLAPDHLRARSRLALLHERMGRKPEAVAEYLRIAGLLQNTGKKEKALGIVLHALELVPTSAEARQALGLLRANQTLPRPGGRTSTPAKTPAFITTPQLKAAQKTAQSEANDPVSEAREMAVARLANLLFEQSLQEEDRSARRGLQAITKGTGPLTIAQVENTKIMLHLSQSLHLQSRGDEVQAAEELERAIDAGLDNAAAYFDLGLLRTKEGRLESALRNLQRAVKHADYALAGRLLLGQTLQQLSRMHDGAVQYLEALCLADAEVIDQAQADALVQIYEPLIESYAQETSLEEKDHARLCEAIHGMLIRPDWRERISQARQQLPKQLPGTPPVPIAELLTQTQSSQVVDFLSSIHQMIQHGYYRLAMEEAFRAIQYAPTYLPLHTVVGEILLQQDQLPDAITKFNVVARAYSARGESGRAIEMYRRIARLSPLDLSARTRLIAQLAAAGKIEESVREHIDLADVHYRLAELDKARETYQKALSVAQQSNIGAHWSVELLHHLADIDLQRLDWRRALRIFEQIRSLDPVDLKALQGVIELNLRLGEETRAFSELGNSIAALNQRGAQGAAVELLENLLQNYSDQITVRRMLAEQYQAGGRRPEAIQAWDQVADALLERGDRAGAIEAMENLLALNPPNAANYRTLLAQLHRGR